MITITEKKYCCGCTACYNICPKSAIQMKPDNEGFLYPVVDTCKCVLCGLCENVCPIKKTVSHKENTEGYIIRYRDADIVKDSTSGGAFTAIAEYFLSNNAVVYGAGYDEDMKVICKQAKTMDELAEMRGSKFVQSNLGDVFRDIKMLLKQEKQVVFSGTPCQVAGLLSYLRKKPENLFCIDFVCRGVPSPMLWENYLSMMQKKYHSKITAAKFKNKTYGYHASTMKIEFSNGKTWKGSGRVDPMMKAFVRELASRPSCEACSFKGIERLSDITMFDCYEFSSIMGLPDDNKGYTSVLIHTNYGKEILEKISPK